MTATLDVLDRYADRFRPHPPSSLLAGLGSRYATLDLGSAPEDLTDAVVTGIGAELELPGSPAAMVLSRFGPGDYALPQRAGEALGSVDWCVYRAFGGSPVDGLTYWSGAEFRRILDADDRPVPLAPDAWCWTSPVRGGVRYAVLVGGAR